MSAIKSVCMKNVAHLGGFAKVGAGAPLGLSAMAQLQVLGVSCSEPAKLLKQHVQLRHRPGAKARRCNQVCTAQRVVESRPVDWDC